MDIKTERRHYLNVPVAARYVRLHPLSWRKRIGLRAGVIGCPHTGDCGPGFLRVNSKSACSKFLIIIAENVVLTILTFQLLTKHSLTRRG